MPHDTFAAPDVASARIDFRAGTGIRHGSVVVRGVRVHYRWSPGSGPAVVLLPGGMVDSSALAWKRTLEALPAAYQVFVPDLPGYGWSETPVGAPYTTEYYVRFFTDFLDAVGVERAGVFGSSMAGAVVLGFALAHPERTRVLGLLGAYGMQPRMRLHPVVRALIAIPGIDVAARKLGRLHPMVMRIALPIAVHHLSTIDDELVADTYAGIQGERALSAFLRWLRSEVGSEGVRSDFTPQLHALEMPVLVLHGEHDLIVPFAAARRAAARIPNVEVHTFDAGHLAARECPDAANEAVCGFLARHLPLDGAPGRL